MRYFTQGMSPLLNKQELNELQRTETQQNRFMGRTGTEPIWRLWPPLLLENTIGETIKPGEHAAIDPTLAWDVAWGQKQNYLPKAMAPEADKHLVIALDYIKDGKPGPFIVLGVALAEVQAGSGEFAEWDATRILKPTDSQTSVRLLGTPSSSEAKLLPVLLGAGGGGGGGVEMYRAVIMTDLQQGAPEYNFFRADVYEMFSANQVASDTPVYSFFAMYDLLVTGDWAVVLKHQDGNYVIIDSPCYKPLTTAGGVINPSP